MAAILDEENRLSIPRPTEPGWVMLVFYDPDTSGQGVLPVPLEELEYSSDENIREHVAYALESREIAKRSVAAQVVGDGRDWSGVTDAEVAEVFDHLRSGT